MTPNRKCFETFEEEEGGLMGNNTECKGMGIGSIKLRMKDGLCRTMTEV